MRLIVCDGDGPVLTDGVCVQEAIAHMEEVADRLAQPTRPREKVPRDRFHSRGDNPHQGTWRYQVGATPVGASSARMNFYT